MQTFQIFILDYYCGTNVKTKNISVDNTFCIPVKCIALCSKPNHLYPDN